MSESLDQIEVTLTVTVSVSISAWESHYRVHPSEVPRSALQYVESTIQESVAPILAVTGVLVEEA
jgi:hypothetical protein